MALFEVDERYTGYVMIRITSGRERVTRHNYANGTRMQFHQGLPGIVWFDDHRDIQFEVLEYRWEGPSYRLVTYEEEPRRTGLFGRSYTRAQKPMPRTETQETAAPAFLRLRNIRTNEFVNLGFKCLSDLDARIRTSIANNLEDTPVPEEKKSSPVQAPDFVAQLKQLKELLDAGAITQEEFEAFKKKLL